MASDEEQKGRRKREREDADESTLVGRKPDTMDESTDDRGKKVEEPVPKAGVKSPSQRRTSQGGENIKDDEPIQRRPGRPLGRGGRSPSPPRRFPPRERKSVSPSRSRDLSPPPPRGRYSDISPRPRPRDGLSPPPGRKRSHYDDGPYSRGGYRDAPYDPRDEGRDGLSPPPFKRPRRDAHPYYDEDPWGRDYDEYGRDYYPDYRGAPPRRGPPPPYAPPRGRVPYDPEFDYPPPPPPPGPYDIPPFDYAPPTGNTPAARPARQSAGGTSGGGGARRGKGGRPSVNFDGAMMSYKQFLETQDDNITPSEGEKKYEEYKNEYQRRQMRLFFKEHKDEEWFKEKYDPEYLEKKKASKIEAAKAAQRVFVERLESGTFAFSLDADASSETKPETEIVDHAAANANAGGETAEAAKDLPVEAEDKPKTKEEKDEEAGAEGGEVVPMEATTTEIAAVSTTTEVVPTPQKDDKKLSAIPLKSRADMDPLTLFIKSVPPTAARAELMEVLGTAGKVLHLKLSEPLKMKNFQRLGWVTYETEEQASEALKKLNGHKMKDFALYLSFHKPSTNVKGTGVGTAGRINYTPAVASEERRIDLDTENARKLIVAMDKDKGLEPVEHLAASSLTGKDLLDRLIWYLRGVHAMCYYCGEEFESEDELTGKCGKLHMRKQKKVQTEETQATEPAETKDKDSKEANNFESSLDNRVRSKLDHIAAAEAHTKEAEEALNKLLEDFFTKNIVLLEAEKYRCALCTKLFRGPEFVRKHISLKHETNIAGVKTKARLEQFFNNYANDPNRMMPVHNRPLDGATSNNTPGSANGRDPVSLARDPYHDRYAPIPPPLPYPGRQDMRYFPYPPPPPLRGRAPPPYGGPSSLGSRRGGGGGGGSDRGRGMDYGRSGAGGRDPRQLTEYVDLDAPSEDTVQIDYRNPLIDYRAASATSS